MLAFGAAIVGMLVSFLAPSSVLEAEGKARPTPKPLAGHAIRSLPAWDGPQLLSATEKGDVFVISTDGLHGLVSPEEIHAELRRSSNRQLSVEALIALANDRGGPDNITLIIAEVDE